MKLIAGLGNPGPKYHHTRHNVGFDVVDILAAKFGNSKAKTKFKGELIEARVDEQVVLLLQPMTYMNLSGQSIQLALGFYKLALSDLLVVCDDINLPLARLRFRARGSAGGQKGLADVVRRLGSVEFSRLRIGVDLPPERMDAADYVLTRFRAGEREAMDVAIHQASYAVADWVREGVDYCMNHYNGE